MIARAWHCQERLHHRSWRMAGRGNPNQKIVIACARELAGFIWALATDQARLASREIARRRDDLTAALADRGFHRVVGEPKYLMASAQRFGLYRAYHYLFELQGR